MARRRNYKFSDKVHPVMGIVSTIIGAVAILIMIILCIISSRSGGNGGIGLGGIGLAVSLLSIGGFALSMISLKQKEIHYSFPVAGALVNGAIMIVCLVLYVIGACV